MTGGTFFRIVWLPDKNKLVKVCLHTRGADVETPWAEDLGAVPGQPGARRVRLGNVPFLHSKPTYEDVIVAVLDPVRRMLMWDSDDVPYDRISERIAEDGGRYAVIIDYKLVPPLTDALTGFKLLDLAGEKMKHRRRGHARPERPPARQGVPRRAVRHHTDAGDGVSGRAEIADEADSGPPGVATR
ncbi:MAG TPA: hypothetical protein VGH20_19830 [Myxococcales bacterium]